VALGGAEPGRTEPEAIGLTHKRIIVVGAGAGGLAAAVDLARAGAEVTVLERGATVGGKMRRLEVAGVAMDAGPTVFTMRWVFDQLFADAGEVLGDRLALHRADVLARHAWPDGGRLDLHADLAASEAAIRDFAGPGDAAGFREFCARAADMHATLAVPFMASQRPSMAELTWRVRNLAALWRTSPLASLWGSLGRHFRDQRLRQLFARYSTYVGSSPFRAPATLMLIAHVESEGVWLVEGGMHALALALAGLAQRQGAMVRTGAHVARILVEGGRARGVELADGERIAADAVLFAGDSAALAGGLLGDAVRPAVPPVARSERSLSAIVWSALEPTEGFSLAHHNVFFGEDYRGEFESVFGGRTVSARPTTYICAQDRGLGAPAPGTPERLLVLVNAPADGDSQGFAQMARGDVAERVRRLLGDCGLGLPLAEETSLVTGPDGFEALFPGTGGGLYGRANHGMMGSFARPGSKSAVPGLYLAGGSVHPGAGVPMATLSGRLAAERMVADLGLPSAPAGG
jgi:1-hydroxycarotenoid 3,4-desaturase